MGVPMKILLISSIFLIASTIATPASALGPKLSPCEAKKMFDAMPLPPATPVAMVAGHAFRKVDVCIPIEIRAQWTNHYRRMDHSFYDMRASEVYPGEFWYRVDREEFVLVANGKNYAGGDKLLSISASGEACHNDNGPDLDTCNDWTVFSNAHVVTVPIFASKSGAFIYSYPTVLTADQTIPEGVNIMAPPFEFRKGPDSYSRPSIVEIDNLDLFDAAPIRYRELVDAAKRKRVVSKQVSWDKNEKTGTTTKHKGTLKLQIAFSRVCPKSFRVVLPAADEKLLFSDATPGSLKIEAEVGAFEQITREQESKITWTAPAKAGSQLTYDPPSRKGKRVAMTYRGLPQNNGDFGPTMITATLPGEGSCDAIRASVQVRLFFPRDAKNHPGGSDPNWFYYWSQTSARVGPKPKFGGGSEFCGKNTSKSDGTLGYYRYKYMPDHYLICDLAGLSTPFVFKTVQWQNNALINVTVKGIDVFGAASRHENSHYSHFKDWWFAYRANPPRVPPADLNKNSILDIKESELDPDGDLVPTSVENQYTDLDPTKKYSYPGPDDDEEILAWKEEANYKIGKADKEDWAKPGKQWP
jgi:hypothetical protein